MKKIWIPYMAFLLAFVVACSPKLAENKTTKTTPVEVEVASNDNGVDLTQKIPNDPSVRMGKLSNGLTYYVKNNGKPADIVELRLAINAGSVLEDDDQQGLAHFMEHMNFNGTTNFNKNELVDYLQGIGIKFGADLNAYTSFDETVYILPIPSDDPEKLESGFTILSDWAYGALLTDKDIDEERGVVLEESRTGKGANDRMNKITIPASFYNSKYATRLPIGKDEILKNFKPDVLRRFYNDWYRPDLMAVVAVGDLDVDALEAMIKKHFGDIPAKENPRERPVYDLPNHKETVVAVAQDPEATYALVRVEYKDRENTPQAETLKDYRKQLVDGLFSFMINNRLSELTQKPNPPFIFASSSYGGTVDKNKNAYSSFAATAPTGQLDALKVILEENQRVKLYGFGKGELERAKTAFASSYESAYNDRDKQESSRLVGQYVQGFLNESRTPSIEWSYKNLVTLLPTISVAEVNERINQYIHDDNRVIIFTGPETDKVPTEEDILKVVENVAKSEIAAYEDAEVRENLIEKMPVAGSITATKSNADLGTTTYTLSNGATVTVKPTDFKNDEILMTAYSYGGSSLYSDEDIKKVTFANGGLYEAGVAGLSQIDMDKYMTGKLVRVSPRISGITEGFSGSSTPKDLETMFQLIHLYFTSLNKDQEAYDSFISKQKSFVGSMMANPETYFSNEVNNMRFKDNPRYMGFPTEEMYDKADYNRAYELYKERFADAGDFHFYLVGNLDKAQVEEFSKQYIASLPGLNSKETYKVSEWREKQGTREITVNKGTEEKSSVRISWAYEIPSYDAQDDMYVDALGEILTIKIIETLREKEGGIYGGGARGNMSKMPYPSFNFNISFPCGPDSVDKLVKATMNEIVLIKKDGPTEKDLNKVKEAYLLEHKENLKSNRYWLSTLSNIDQEKRDIKEVLEFETKVNNMTADGVKSVANKYLTTDYLLAVLKPETK